MKYEVLHVRRIADMTHLKNLLAHNARENIDRSAPDSLPDWIKRDWKPDGLHRDGQSSEKALSAREKLLEGLKRKVQKNASVAIEFNVSAGKDLKTGEDFAKWKDYFYAAEKYLCERYGRENLISSAIHTDESSPHLHLLFVPIITTEKGERRYAASAFLGNRTQMAQLHTEFHGKVGQRFGLERGEEGSRAKHGDARDLNRRLKEVTEREADLQTQKDSLLYEESKLELRQIDIDKKNTETKRELEERERFANSRIEEAKKQEAKAKAAEAGLQEKLNRLEDIEKREATLKTKEENFNRNVRHFKDKDVPTTEDEEIVSKAIYDWSQKKARGQPYRPANLDAIMKAVQTVFKVLKNKVYELENLRPQSQNLDIGIER